MNDGPGAANQTAPAAVRETHVGVVVCIGDRAFKVKKAVATAFCDFSTPALRRRALERELALNRRLAADVYHGVGELTAPAGDPTPPEPVLLMRRMPADRRLAELIRRGQDVDEALRATARIMAAFHASACRGPAISTEGGVAALTDRWRKNLAELQPFRNRPVDGTDLDAIGRLAEMFLAGRGPLFAARQDAGRIVDGHGDLLAEDIFCLDDGPRLLDCLDFDDRLRYVDGLDDVAFLAMDLERLGAPRAADRLLDLYAEFSGDPAPAGLRHHYIAYRAVVRAKVACLRHDQGDEDAAADAATHLSLARSHLEDGAVRLALVGGLPGTGKSTLGTALADAVGAVLISSDRVRKELSGLGPADRAPAAFREGFYDEAHTDAVYAELLRRAGELLGRGESVVLDASWTSAARRRSAARLARTTRSALVCLECHTTAETAAGRITTRPPTASDATPEIATAMAATAEPWPDAVTVSTSGTITASAAQAIAVWRATAVPPAGPPSML